MKLYVASSWRNEHQPGVVEVLRLARHEVYDFRRPDPADPENHGFAWRDVDPEWTPRSLNGLVDVPRWRRMLAHPLAYRGFMLDLRALEWCDACVYVLPCGRSASWELGHAMGRGKPGIVLALEPVEPELMFSGAAICGSIPELLEALEVFRFCLARDGGGELEAAK